MLTVITDITQYQLSKNPVVAQLETDSFLVTPGVAAYVRMDVSNANGANAVGGTLTLIWQTDSVIFTIATTPDDSGTQVRPKAALSDSAYALQLIGDLNKNYIISENFILTQSSGNITFTAKNAGNAFALYTNFDSLNFGYIINATHNDGTDTVYAENYKMKADLWMESTFQENDYTKKGTIELDPLNNRCIFDFQTQINANLAYDLPTYNQSSINNCNNVIKIFYIRYLEKYGNPVAQKAVFNTATSFVLKAGIPNEEAPGKINLIESMFRTPGNFLTRQPRTKKIRATQQEFLYFCMPTIDVIIGGGGNIHLIISIYKKDNMGNDIIIKYNSTNTQPYQVHCIPTGFTSLGLSSQVDWDNLKKYTVKVYSENSSKIVSEIFTYIPDLDHFIDEHYLLFSNSCGGVDTLRCTGVLETDLEIEKDTVQKTNLFNTPVITGQYAEVSHQKTDKYKISTGWITREAADWIEDLFLAEKKFVDRDGQFIPIILSTTAFKKYDSNTNLYSYDLEYSTAFKNRVPKSLALEIEETEEGS